MTSRGHLLLRIAALAVIVATWALPRAGARAVGSAPGDVTAVASR